MFEINKLTKVIQGKKILSINYLHLEKGKLHSLRGQNGAGKTTLLHILALLSSPSSGTVKFFGENINYSSEKELLKLRKDIVLMEQMPIMFSGSVAKNICFGLKARKFSKIEQEKKLDEVLELLEIKHLKDYRANTLSGGETQRVALARTLILEPKCLILDEPTASLDKSSRELIEKILKNLTPKYTLIMTTHSEEQNALLSQNTITLDNGLLVK